MTKTAATFLTPGVLLRPAEVLFNLLVTLLAPTFLATAGSNLEFARAAAAETVNAYRAQTEADLIAVAQIVAFGLAALGSLSQSMEDDLSIAVTLRLRGNAIGCSRCAQQNRKSLTERRPDQPSVVVSPFVPESDPEPDIDAALQSNQAAERNEVPEISETPDPNETPDSNENLETEDVHQLDVEEFNEAEVIAAVAATRKRADENLARFMPLAAPAPSAELTAEEKHYNAMWAAGAAKVAAEITAELHTLPPSEREAATIRAAALSDCANELLTGKLPPRMRPGDLAGLMSPNGF